MDKIIQEGFYSSSNFYIYLTVGLFILFISFFLAMYNIKSFRELFTHQIPFIVNDFFSSMKNNSDFRYEYLKYFILYVIIIIILLFVFNNKTDGNLFQTSETIFNVNNVMNSLLFIIPLSILVYFIYENLNKTNNNKKTFFYGIPLFFLSIILYFLYSNLSQATTVYVNYLFIGLFSLIFITSLAIFLLIFNNYLKTFSGWYGFFIYFIFYIPCIFVEFIDFIKSELKATTNTVYILFILEIIFILCYVYLPNLIKNYMNSFGKCLLEKCVFLKEEKVIATFNDLNNDRINHANNENNKMNQNFAISMWCYINTQSKSNSSYVKESNIFDYGNGKLKIIYNYDLSNNINDGNKNNYRFYFAKKKINGIDNFYELNLPDQKWNNIVVNNRYNNVDIFINGKIAKTFTYNNVYQPPTYSESDIMKIGSNNGLYGSMCNVRYYSKPLTKFEIANNYNMLMMNNPPIFS